jgi:hypothetical protein
VAASVVLVSIKRAGKGASPIFKKNHGLGLTDSTEQFRILQMRVTSPTPRTRRKIKVGRLPKILLIALGFGLLTVAVGFLTSTPAPAAPNSIPVTVVNTPSTPVPTAAQGITNVAGGVSIVGTPGVSLVPGARVNIANVPDSEGNPAPLVVRDHTPTQPFHMMLCIDYGTAAGMCQSNFPPAQSTVRVPTTTSDGHPVERMVIENITGSCESFGQHVVQLILSTTLNENSPTATLFDVIPVSTQDIGLQTSSQQTRLYAEPDSLLTLYVGISGGPTNGSVCSLVLTGYLTTQTP